MLLSVAGQKLFQFSRGIGIGKLGKDEFEVIKHLEAIEFGAFNQTVEIRRSNGTLDFTCQVLFWFSQINYNTLIIKMK